MAGRPGGLEVRGHLGGVLEGAGGGRCLRVFPARPLSGQPSRGRRNPRRGLEARTGRPHPAWGDEKAQLGLPMGSGLPAPPGDGRPWAQENSSHRNTRWDLHASGRDPLYPRPLRSSLCLPETPV